MSNIFLNEIYTSSSNEMFSKSTIKSIYDKTVIDVNKILKDYICFQSLSDFIDYTKSFMRVYKLNKDISIRKIDSIYGLVYKKYNYRFKIVDKNKLIFKKLILSFNLIMWSFSKSKNSYMMAPSNIHQDIIKYFDNRVIIYNLFNSEL